MGSLDHLAALVSPTAPDEWYVTDGATAVGPVTLALLLRGVEAGKVPRDGFVRHISWGGWRGLADLTEHDPSFDPRRTFKVLPVPKLSEPKVAIPRPPPRDTLDSSDLVEDLSSDSDGKPSEPEVIDVAPKPTASVPTEQGATFEGASDLAEAMLILLATSVAECEAEAALVHRVRDEGALVVCSHGPRMFELLGEKLVHGDPVHFAARQGQTVFAEPVPGVAGRAIRARLSRLGATVESAFMVPMHVDGKLSALIEVGRAKPFRASDVARVEELIETLVATIGRLDWSREWRAARAVGAAAEKAG